MTVKEDLRVRKTKKALSDAFFEMLSEKTFDEITINELCDRAGVRRATFYKHYTDKFNFFTSFVKNLRDRFDNLIWKSEKPDTTPKYYVAYAKRLISFSSENETVIDNMMKSDLLPTCISVLISQNYQDTKERLDRSVSAGMPLCAPTDVIAQMCAGGVCTTVYSWLVDGKKKDADTLGDEVGAVVTSILKGCGA